MFARTCDGARKLALMLRNLGFDALPIHGQMSQPKRLGALNKFKAGERSILVATGARAAFRALHVCVRMFWSERGKRSILAATGTAAFSLRL